MVAPGTCMLLLWLGGYGYGDSRTVADSERLCARCFYEICCCGLSGSSHRGLRHVENESVCVAQPCSSLWRAHFQVVEFRGTWSKTRSCRPSFYDTRLLVLCHSGDASDLGLAKSAYMGCTLYGIYGRELLYIQSCALCVRGSDQPSKCT